MSSQLFAIATRALEYAIVDSERTQRAIARRLRMDETRLSRIVNRKVRATPREREKLSRFFQKPEAELFQLPADQEAVAS